MPDKLRIAVWYNLPSGGGKRALHDHLRGLKARGHEIVAWRPPVPQADYLPISEIVEEHEVPLGELRRGAPAQIGHLLRSTTALGESMREHSEAAAKAVDAGKFDVLFANSCLQYQAAWIGRFVHLPRLIYLQEPKRFFYEAFPRLPWLALPDDVRHSFRPDAIKRRLRDGLETRQYRIQAADELQNAQSYDRILVNSNFSRESVLRAYGLDSTVCYLGIDAERFENRGLPREPYVVSVGTFHASKGPEFVVRALATIAENRPPLVWVANTVFDEERNRVEALAKGLGVDLRIRQYVPDSELMEILNRASVLAYAPRLEPFGYAPLEANACGLPSVVVSEGGVKESVKDGLNGVVVPHRPEAMGAAIARLLADPDTARAMGERAAVHVREHWTLERATDDLERNLLEVAGRR